MQKSHRILVSFTGFVTMLPVLQFFFPHMLLQASSLSIHDDAGLFYARHWGLLCFVLGAMIIYANNRVELLRTVLAAAALEKLGLVALTAIEWNNPVLAGLHVPAIFDGLCTLYYGYLIRSLKGH